MTESLETLVPRVSIQLREWIHEVNNALFVTKGFLEEIEADVKEKTYQNRGFDHDNFADMLSTIMRNVEKIDQNLQRLRKFAKQDIFQISGIPPP